MSDAAATFDALQAAAAARKVVVQRLPDARGYIVSRWMYARRCEDMAALVALLERMGVKA